MSQTGDEFRLHLEKIVRESELGAKKAAADLAAPMAKVGDAMRKLGEEVARGADRAAAQAIHRAAAEKKLAEGVPLDRWSTVELMAILPAKAKDSERLGELTDFQLACLVQHCLNNCSQKDAISYDGALQLKYGPELLRRLMKKPGRTAEAMRVAWSLYRSGAATLEEITPLMDRAEDEASAPQTAQAPRGPADGLGLGWCGSDPAKQSPSHGTPRLRPARIPRAIAQMGGELVCDAIAYVVIKEGNASHPNTVMLAELDDNNVRIAGGCFWVNVV